MLLSLRTSLVGALHDAIMADIDWIWLIVTRKRVASRSKGSIEKESMSVDHQMKGSGGC